MKMDELVKVSQSMVANFTYKGSFENLPPCGNDGYVIFCNEKSYVYTGAEWEMIGVCEKSEKSHKPQLHYKQLPTNCKNCGAVLLNSKCEYCGTRY